MNTEDIKRKVFNRIKDDQEYKEIPEKLLRESQEKLQ